MRTHDEKKMSTLLFMVGLMSHHLKTERDLLIICDDQAELFVTDDADEAIAFVRGLPFH